MRINKGLLTHLRLLITGLVGLLGVLTIIASVENPPRTNYVWVKPNSTDQDYKRDNFVCLKESQQRVSEYSRDGRYASSTSTLQTNNSLYNACMNARGWSLHMEKIKKIKKAKKNETDQIVDDNKNNNMSPVVKNLTVGQRGDKAIATYDLVGNNGEKVADVTVAININGKRHSAETLHLTGAFGKSVKVGPGKQIIWNAMADLPSNFDGELSWDVKAVSVKKAKPAKVMKKAHKTDPVIN